MTSHRRVPLLVLVVATVLCAAAPAAIMIRHDRDDARYRALGGRYPMVGRVSDSVESTLIAPNWVITAAHAVERSGSPFEKPLRVTFDGRDYAVDRVVIHPKRAYRATDAAGDMALLRLDEPVVGIEPAELHQAFDEAGKEIVVVGRGATGNGLSGPDEALGEALRGATNRVDKADGDILAWSFDAPPGGTDLEGISGPGDSGGPAFLAGVGRVVLLGVSSTNSGDSESTFCRYGSVESYARVSTSRTWILDAMRTDASSTVTWGPVRRATDARQLPGTPVGRLMADFVRAFNEGHEEAVYSVVDRYRDPARPAPTAESRARSLKMWRGMMNDYGRYELHSYAESSDGRLQALVYATDAKIWRVIGLGLTDTTPARVTDFFVRDYSLPPPAAPR